MELYKIICVRWGIFLKIFVKSCVFYAGMLKPGDKIRFLNRDPIGWERKAVSNFYKFGDVYTVSMIVKDHLTTVEESINWYPDPYEVHPDHFEKVK